MQSLSLSTPVSELIARRFSCRHYQTEPLQKEYVQSINQFLGAITEGPLGTPLRVQLLAATEDTLDALKGMGTYGFIKNPAGFLVGAVSSAAKNLEDYGYVLERLILGLTQMGLGSCWLGGSFTRSRFARALGLGDDEVMPAVVSVGIIGDPQRAKKSLIRRLVGSDGRKPLQELFFAGTFATPLTPDTAGAAAPLLGLVQWAPSASNKQPWRIVKIDQYWHFFLMRTKGYATGFASKLAKLADIQRLDMGIALCHWELGAAQQGLQGSWVIEPPSLVLPRSLTEYVISWKMC
jgi:hypothetical protein